MYTDFNYIPGEGTKWNIKVYPDIKGNKEKAIKQILKWLNTPELKKL